MNFEDALERHQRIVKAAENWSPQYEKDPETHAGIIKVEAKLERGLRGYFKELADRIDGYIIWPDYAVKLRQLHASEEFSVDVLIQDDAFGREDAIFIQAVYDPAAAAVALGAQSGETIYQVNLGLSETSATVQRAAKELVAELVGKKVTPDGLIVDNPRAKYRVLDKTREDIRESVARSLTLGEDQPTATKRLQKVISDPRRAATIARTEAVNAYQKGLMIMGDQSGAVGKEWLSVNADDVCGVYGSIGPVALNYVYNKVTGLKAPAAHPNCRCSIRLIYQGDPSADKISSNPNFVPDEDLTTGYHGSGANLANGNYALGDTFYVTRDSKTAESFGKVKKYELNISKNDILLIENNDQYTNLVAEALRAYPGVNFNTAFPDYIKAKGFKAVEMSAELDPLAGIAVVDPKLIP